MNAPDSCMDPRVKRVTLWGGILNVVLSVLKVVLGTVAGSIALVADGLHSLSDLASDAVVLVGAWAAARPADESHPYGHGKFETFAAVTVASLLIAVGAGIAWEAGQALYLHETSQPGLVVVVVALVSILAKEALYQATRRVAMATRSPSVLANAWHHRSDALSSVAVLFGGVAGVLGWEHGDQVAGIVVGLMIVGAGVQIAWGSLRDLSEHAIEREAIEGIQVCLDAKPELRGWHSLRTRKVGRDVFLDVHIQLDPDLSVREGHRIAHEVAEDILREVRLPITFGIHMEPHDDPQGPSHS